MWQPALTPIETRVLGALVEKAAVTPDNYPLSMPSLLAACNQATSREPVMQLDEDGVMPAVVALRRRSLLRAIQPAGSRVTKYQHLLDEALDLGAPELALLSVLMLRGPQTAAELFARTTRLASFADHDAVGATLEGLMHRQPDALVVRLPRRPGQKEVRYAHLLGGEVTESSVEAVPGAGEVESGTDRLAEVATELAQLKSELAALRAEFDAFRRQFG